MEKKYELLRFILTKISKENEHGKSLIKQGNYKEAQIVNERVGILFDLYNDIKDFLNESKGD